MSADALSHAGQKIYQNKFWFLGYISNFMEEVIIARANWNQNQLSLIDSFILI